VRDGRNRDPAQADRFFGNRPESGSGQAFDADHWRTKLARPDLVIRENAGELITVVLMRDGMLLRAARRESVYSKQEDAMASPLRNILAGSSVAALLAVLLATPTIAGVSAWKVVLAVFGLMLFFSSYGRRAETK